jgi:putative DNA primase/helicase
MSAPYDKPNKKPVVPVLTKHPLYDAKAFKRDRRPNLVKQSSNWLDYDPKGCYVVLEDGTVYSEAQKYLESATVENEAPVADENGKPKKDEKGKPILEPAMAPYSPVPSNVNGLVEMLGNDVHVPFNVNPPPCWLRGKDQDKLSCDIINVANGLLHYPTRALLPHTPDYFSTSVLPMQYDAKAGCPTFMRFISEVMKGRPHLIEGLQEAIGYSLSSNRNLQKIIFGKGPPGSGKGTLARVLQALHGAGNFSNPTMFDLDEKYGLEGTIGKAAMIVTDVTPRMSSMDHAAEFLKGVSGQDNREVRRMAKPAWQGVIGAQIWMFGKHMPNFGVSAEEINRRLIVFPFDVSFVDKADADLTAKLLAELSGILNWALVGYGRLMKRGAFVESDESKEAKKQLLNLSDPVMAFVGERCEVAPDEWIERPLLTAIYEHWSAENAQNTLAAKTFSQRLLDAYQGRVTMGERRRVAYGPRSADYAALDNTRMVDIVRGLRLNDEWRAQVYLVDETRVDFEGVDPADALELDETGAPIPSPAWSKWESVA